jgi:hypothetical protein
MSNRFTRRSQSVVPFGVGAIVEFEDEAVMSAGLDVWPKEAESIRDERLAERLDVDHFRVPPPKPQLNGIPGTMSPMPYVRFPQWHFCPRCRFLRRVDLFALRPPRCDNPESSKWLHGKKPCGQQSERARRYVMPLRFVAACEAGHIEDFPWNAWAHSKAGDALDRTVGCKPATLYFYPTRRSGLSGLMILCSTCGNKRSLMGSTNVAGLKGFGCIGTRPWLGNDSEEMCAAASTGGQPPRMLALQRGASNLYFPEVTSSILIPPFSSKLYRILREPSVWETLVERRRSSGSIPDDVFATIASIKKVDVEQLKEAFRTIDAGSQGESLTGADETPFRYAEYRALHQERRDQDDLLACRPQDISQYGPLVTEHLSAVTLVERLAETRALTGFSRINPAGALAALSRRPASWLPAFRVHGEGIFLVLHEARLAKVRNASESRAQVVIERSLRSRQCPLILSGELILLHNLAHALIKRLSYEAGYGASSIRERIYSAPPRHAQRMCGILLYTAAGDADGTLGGLVSLGRKGTLERMLAGALEDLSWCAADPICMESPGQGPESLNRAACHSCSLLPETSCEMQNRFLDREPVLRYFE